MVDPVRDNVLTFLVVFLLLRLLIWLIRITPEFPTNECEASLWDRLLRYIGAVVERQINKRVKE